MQQKKQQFQLQVTARIKPCEKIEQNCEEILLKQCQKLRFKNILQSDVQQQTVFDNQIQPLLESYIQGYNCTIMAYGQTGSGKTHTIFGPPNCIHQYKISQQQQQQQFQEQQKQQNYLDQTPQDWGMFPRSMNFILNKLEELQNQGEVKNVSLKLTAVEIYLEQTYDLLDNSRRIALTSTQKVSKQANGLLGNLTNAQYDENGKWVNPFQAKKNYENTFELKGSKEKIIKSIEDVVEFTKLVESVRVSKGHDINARSSRSHCVITISMQYQQGKKVVKPKFLFIDLAGSERISRSGVQGQKLKESTSTNLSLTQLGRCLNAIAQNQFVPYRDSTLTMLIKDSFNGNTRTGMFINLSSDIKYLDESIISLQFGQRSSKITNTVSVNSRQSVDAAQMKKQVQIQLKKAQQELKQLDDKGMKGGLNNDAPQHLQQAFLYNQGQLEENKEKMVKIKSKIAELKCMGQENSQEFLQYVQEQKYVESEIEKFKGMVIRQMSTGIYKNSSSSYANKEREIQAIQQQMQELQEIDQE